MFSESFKINVNKNASEEKLISLVRVSHESLTSPVCLVQDNERIIFEDEEYIPFPMTIKMESQVEGELPKAVIVIPNMAKQIVKWIDSTMGARGGKIEVIITRRSTLEREYGVIFNIDNVKITITDIVFDVTVQNNLSKPAIRARYNKKFSPGLFL